MLFALRLQAALSLQFEVDIDKGRGAGAVGCGLATQHAGGHPVQFVLNQRYKWIERCTLTFAKSCMNRFAADKSMAISRVYTN